MLTTLSGKRDTRPGCTKTNWDGGENPFSLPKPPEFILKALKDYDSYLLVLPGLTQAVYRLAVRAPDAKRLKAIANDSETGRMIRIGCVPLTSVVRNPDWWKVLQWVKDHDTWAAGGGEKFAKQIEDNERAAAAKLDAEIDDEGSQRAISGWHGWKFRTGQATFVQDASRTMQQDDRPSGLHAGPGHEVANVTHACESTPGQAEGSGRIPEAAHPGRAEDAVLAPGAARRES
jgi:hypothetical protein